MSLLRDYMVTVQRFSKATRYWTHRAPILKKSWFIYTLDLEHMLPVEYKDRGRFLESP